MGLRKEVRGGKTTNHVRVLISCSKTVWITGGENCVLPNREISIAVNRRPQLIASSHEQHLWLVRAEVVARSESVRQIAVSMEPTAT